MDELTKLAIKYGTDKWGKHHYTPVYYGLFKDRRIQVRKVLEIGSAEGAGVRMFRDFFPVASIYGADNVIERIFEEERIQIYYFDQSKDSEYEEFSDYFGKNFDLIVDDGSHVPEDQLKSCVNLVLYLSPDGIYVIEDVNEPSLVKLLKEEFIKRDRKLHYDIKEVVVGDRYDDRLIIVRHKDE